MLVENRIPDPNAVSRARPTSQSDTLRYWSALPVYSQYSLYCENSCLWSLSSRDDDDCICKAAGLGNTSYLGHPHIGRVNLPHASHAHGKQVTFLQGRVRFPVLLEHLPPRGVAATSQTRPRSLSAGVQEPHNVVATACGTLRGEGGDFILTRTRCAPARSLRLPQLGWEAA
jgi:hypothetical protein